MKRSPYNFTFGTVEDTFNHEDAVHVSVEEGIVKPTQLTLFNRLCGLLTIDLHQKDIDRIVIKHLKHRGGFQAYIYHVCIDLDDYQYQLDPLKYHLTIAMFKTRLDTYYLSGSFDSKMFEVLDNKQWAIVGANPYPVIEEEPMLGHKQIEAPKVYDISLRTPYFEEIKKEKP